MLGLRLMGKKGLDAYTFGRFDPSKNQCQAPLGLCCATFCCLRNLRHLIISNYTNSLRHASQVPNEGHLIEACAALRYEFVKFDIILFVSNYEFV